MTSIQERAIESKAVADLRVRFRGALLRPTEEGYDEARRVWNGAIDRRPDLIARCAGTDDVVEAVRFARERDLPASVVGMEFMGAVDDPDHGEVWHWSLQRADRRQGYSNPKEVTIWSS